jgi:hypothetical protein
MRVVPVYAFHDGKVLMGARSVQELMAVIKQDSGTE